MSKAFDSVNLNLLCSNLERVGLSSTFLQNLVMLLTNNIIIIEAYKSKKFCYKMTRGLLQGDPLSGILFNFYIGDFIDVLNLKTLDNKYIYNIPPLAVISFADDILFLNTSPKALQKTLTAFNIYCLNYELKINHEKTKIVIFQNGGRRSGKYQFILDGQQIEITDQIKYLGVLFSRTGNFSLHFNKVRNKFNLQIIALLSLTARLKVNYLQIHLRLYDSLIRSSMGYAFPIWGIEFVSKMENLRVNFLRRLLYLEKSVPGSVVRLETSIWNSEVFCIKLILKFIQRLISKEEKIFPGFFY